MFENNGNAKSVTIMIHTEDGQAAITSVSDVPVTIYGNAGHELQLSPTTSATHTFHEASLRRIAFHESVSVKKIERLKGLLPGSKAFKRCRASLVRNEIFLRRLRDHLTMRLIKKLPGVQHVEEQRQAAE